MAGGAPVRIGVLGAAGVVPMALSGPARSVGEVEVAAIAARDPERARAFARRHGIPKVHDSYSALLDDPDLDAVYVPLPNNLHAEWTLRALRAGKHVLCEKPFASNAREAMEVASLARKLRLVASEGFAYRYHPLASRIREILASGEIGAVRDISAEFCYANPMTNNIRFKLALSGGSTMDAGCYPVSLVRFVAGAEPTVVSARARELSAGVDRRMEAALAFPDGRTGRIVCAMLSRTLFRARLTVSGEAGALRVLGPYHPQWFNSLTVRTSARARHEHVEGESPFVYQLRAFAAAVRGGAPLSTGPDDAVGNMRLIDAIYEKAGMRPRGL